MILLIEFKFYKTLKLFHYWRTNSNNCIMRSIIFFKLTSVEKKERFSADVKHRIEQFQ